MRAYAAGLLILSLGGYYLGAQGHSQGNGPEASRAIAILHPVGASGVQGTILFQQRHDHVEITGEVRGLKPGWHGFHVHEFGDCSAPDASSAGGHFNPTNMPHGGPHDSHRHVGDLGNIHADEYGRAVVHLKDRMIQLHGPHSIIGRSIIVHSDPDDFKTQPTGNSGTRLACGVIGIASSGVTPAPHSAPAQKQPRFFKKGPLRKWLPLGPAN